MDCNISMIWLSVIGSNPLQDPHFKVSTHRRRIISTAQLADYAYLLAPGGMLYTITDVPELGAWMREKVLAPFSASGNLRSFSATLCVHL